MMKRYLLLTIILLSMLSHLYAQSLADKNDHIHMSNGDHYESRAVCIYDGYCYVGAQMDSAGANRPVISRLTLDGRMIYTRRLPNAESQGNVYGNGVAAIRGYNGHLYVVSQQFDSLFHPRLQVFCMDTDGHMTDSAGFTFAVGQGNYIQPTDFIFSSDGYMYVAGFICLVNIGAPDRSTYIFKLDNHLHKVWERHFQEPGSGDYNFFSNVVEVDANRIVCLGSQYNNDYSDIRNSTSQTFLCEIDSSGVMSRWVKEPTRYARRIVRDWPNVTDQYIQVSHGGYNSSLTYQNSHLYYIYRYDTLQKYRFAYDGTVQYDNGAWASDIVKRDTALELVSATTLPDPVRMVSGCNKSLYVFSTNFREVAPGYTHKTRMIHKYSEALTLFSSDTFYTAVHTYSDVTSMASDSEGHVAVAEHINQLMELSTGSDSLCHTAFATGTDDMAAAADWSAYPVPAHSSITIYLPDHTGTERYSISEMSGRCVMSGMLAGTYTSVDIAALSAGIYIVDLDDRVSKKIKIVKE